MFTCINLTSVTNAQTVNVSLTSVNDASGNFRSGVSGSMAVLVGDINGTGAVTNTDVATTKAQGAAPVI